MKFFRASSVGVESQNKDGALEEKEVAIVGGSLLTGEFGGVKSKVAEALLAN